jgi:hypothetical protein
MPNFKIGCDPEMFLQERETGIFRSAIPFIKGTKQKPQPLPHGGNVQFDNVAIEFGTEPAETVDDFVAGIQKVLADLQDVIPPELMLADVPSAFFPQEELEHPEAKRFGCDPDFDVWAMEENTAPTPFDPTFRSCGGHIHVGVADGYEFLTEWDGKFAVIKMMDTFHGVISTILDNSKEAIERRRLYGKAGCHRPTDYGIEYRALSNYWIKSPVLCMLMYHLTKDVLEVVAQNKHDELVNDIGNAEIQRIINEGDVEAAKKVLEVHLDKHLSEDSRHYLATAMENIKSYSIAKEWEVLA